MSLLSEVFNAHAKEKNPTRMHKANMAFKVEQERVRTQREAAALIEWKKMHSNHTKMGIAIRKAHDTRDLPPMTRKQRQTARDFAMTVQPIHDVANQAKADITNIEDRVTSHFDRKMDRLIDRLNA